MSFGAGWGLNRPIPFRWFLSLLYPQDQVLFRSRSQPRRPTTAWAIQGMSPSSQPNASCLRCLFPGHSEHGPVLTTPSLLLNGDGWLSGKSEDLLRVGWPSSLFFTLVWRLLLHRSHNSFLFLLPESNRSSHSSYSQGLSSLGDVSFRRVWFLGWFCMWVTQVRGGSEPKAPSHKLLCASGGVISGSLWARSPSLCLW